MDLDVSPAGWLATVGLIAVLLAIDLTLAGFGRTGSVRGAAVWSGFYVAVAITFGVVFGVLVGWGFGAQYFASHIVEKSLSIDNLFVFVVIMTTFAVPPEHQRRVLTFGMVAALVLAASSSRSGAALLSAFSFMFLLFGLALLVTAVQRFRHRDEDPSLEDNAAVALARRLLPFTERYDGGRLVTRFKGRRVFTPLVLVFIALASTDTLFALDSIPAVFGITEEPYIVFTANAFALLGRRALYFLVTDLLNRLIYLSTGLSVILAFIGIKLMLHYLHLQSGDVAEISTGASLAVIVGVLTITTVASIIAARRNPRARAHAGSLRVREPAPTDA